MGEEELGARCSYAGTAFRTVGCLAKGMFRKPVVGGNWKCVVGSPKLANDLLKAFVACGPNPDKVQTVIFPPAVFVPGCKAALGDGAPVEIGIQNASKTGEGAFTGEVTVGQVKDMGIPWVMVGHSERRTLYGETDAECGEKVAKVLEKNLNVMMCIGGTLAERQAGETQAVCAKQLDAVIPKI